MDDDDYWNTSDTKARALSFDDDVLSPQEILAIGQQKYSGQSDDIFSAASISSVRTDQLPLSSILSSKVLDLILSAMSGRAPPPAPPPPPSVPSSLRRLALGRPGALTAHRSLRDKTQLLDGAISIGDGNAVLTVVLFLIQTLNKKLVYELLSSRPLALAHYISFLQNEGKVTELTDLLTMLGRSPEAAIYQLQHIVKAQGNNVDGLIRKLTNLLANHFNQPGVDTHQCKMVNDYVKLLEWQKHASKPDLSNAPALRCLAHCCRLHWHEGAPSAMSPLTLCQRQQIPPIQYEWVVLNVHAKSNKWDIVESLFTKKDWLGRVSLSCHVPPEPLLSRLSALGAPAPLLAAAVTRLPDHDQRLQLAIAYKIHSVVIETFAKQKDRAALSNYKMSLKPQSQEYILAENTLRDPAIKWRN